MRISADLPHDLWPETVAAATYILNHTLMLKTGITPFEALYGIKQDSDIWKLMAVELILSSTILQNFES